MWCSYQKYLFYFIVLVWGSHTFFFFLFWARQVYALVCLFILHLCCTSLTFAVRKENFVECAIKNLPRCLDLGCAGEISKPSVYWCYPAPLSKSLCGYFSRSCSFPSPGISNLALKSFCMGARAPVCLGTFQVIDKKLHYYIPPVFFSFQICNIGLCVWVERCLHLTKKKTLMFLVRYLANKMCY